MKIRTLEYFIREAFGSIRHNGLMSLASVSTVALTLLILGMFLIMVLNMNHMAGALESQVQISVYLQEKLSDEEVAAIQEKIARLPSVQKVEYVSKDKALERFRDQLGEQGTILNDLGETNPLPNGFDILVEQPDQVRAVAQTVQNIQGVEKLRYEKEIVERLFKITRMIRTVGLIIIVFLALAAMFIISNTIRLTVFARRREIGIMKYVGATDWFIRWPFLLEGMILGFLGAFIAVLLLMKLYNVLIGYIVASIAFMPILPSYPIMQYLAVFLLGVGMAIGALGSTISLRRFLHV